MAKKTVTAKLGWAVEELAEVFPMSKSWWWTNVRSGELKTVRFGRRRIVMQRDLEAFLRRKGVAA